MLAMWEWQEGVPAVDLAQTVRDVRARPVDDLRSDDDLDAWLASQEDRVPRLAPGERDIAAWRSLREEIAAAFSATLAGEPLPPRAIEHINVCPAPPFRRAGGGRPAPRRRDRAHQRLRRPGRPAAARRPPRVPARWRAERAR